MVRPEMTCGTITKQQSHVKYFLRASKGGLLDKPRRGKWERGGYKEDKMY